MDKSWVTRTKSKLKEHEKSETKTTGIGRQSRKYGWNRRIWDTRMQWSNKYNMDRDTNHVNFLLAPSCPGFFLSLVLGSKVNIPAEKKRV